MTVEPESHKPNEAGFAGDPTTPEPERTPDTAEAEAEGVAVPGGDLTGAVSDALETATDREH